MKSLVTLFTLFVSFNSFSQLLETGNFTFSYHHTGKISVLLNVSDIVRRVEGPDSFSIKFYKVDGKKEELVLVVRSDAIYDGKSNKICVKEKVGKDKYIFKSLTGIFCETTPLVLGTPSVVDFFMDSFDGHSDRIGFINGVKHKYRFEVSNYEFTHYSAHWDKKHSRYPEAIKTLIDDDKNIDFIKKIKKSLHIEKNLKAFLIDEKTKESTSIHMIGINDINDKDCSTYSKRLFKPNLSGKVDSFLITKLQEGLLKEEVNFLLTKLSRYNFLRLDYDEPSDKVKVYPGRISIKIQENELFSRISLKASPPQRYFGKRYGVDDKRRSYNAFGLGFRLKEGISCQDFFKILK